MQENKEWRQLNLPAESTYIEFPIAFAGKPPKGSKATVYTGLPLSCGFFLAVIHTMNKMFGGFAEITYKYMQDRFGMYPSTLSAAKKLLIDKKIIEEAGRSKYEIIAYYNKNYVKVYDCLFQKEFYEVYEKSDGQIIEQFKQLSYSRIFALSYLKRANENEKENGVYISSPSRLGKAIGLPASTAGDTVRELKAGDLLRTEKPSHNNKRQHGCLQYIVNPEIKAIKPPKNSNFEAVDDVYKADELHRRLMLDTEYKGLMERIDVNATAYMEVLRHNGLDTPESEKLLDEAAELRQERDRYFAVHNVDRNVFPPGFFKCDIIEYDELQA